MKILIVDDNARMRSIVKQLITDVDSKNQFYECADGDSAVQMYKTILPDRVVMDIRMPILDGFSASEMILKIDPEAQIVILTNFDEIEFRQEAERIGVRGYIVKENLNQLKSLFHSLQKSSDE